MEHNIGEEFNVILRVKPKEGRGGDYDCSRCAISKVCSRTYDSVSPCCNTQRKDGRYVYFELVSVKDENEMKQQENIPEENTNNTITNDSLDLTKILKNCPAGHKFYSPIYGDVEFLMLLDSGKIRFQCYDSGVCYNLVVKSDGKLHDNGECLVFPSREQRDWGKFEAPWYRSVNRNNDGILKIKLDLEEQIKWYDTFLYYSDLFPNESIEYVIKCTNARVYGDKNKQ